MSDVAHLTAGELEQELRRRGVDVEEDGGIRCLTGAGREWLTEGERDAYWRALEALGEDSADEAARVGLAELVAAALRRIAAGVPVEGSVALKRRRFPELYDYIDRAMAGDGDALLALYPVHTAPAGCECFYCLDEDTFRARHYAADGSPIRRAAVAPASVWGTSSAPGMPVQEPEPLVVEDIPAEVPQGPPEPVGEAPASRRRAELSGREWRSKSRAESPWDRIF